jgi:hypothetical protein
MIPAILGIGALVLVVILLIGDKNKSVSLKFSNDILGQENPYQRISSTVKGFLLIICLVVILATLIYYFG